MEPLGAAEVLLFARRTSENSCSRNCLKKDRTGLWRTLLSMKRSYPTDLTDAEWKHIELLVPASKPRARQRTHSPRQVLNAVFYVLRSGCPWRLLPRQYPPWKTLYHYFFRK